MADDADSTEVGVDGEYVEVEHTFDLEDLDRFDIDNGDSVELHYISQREPSDADDRTVRRRVEYRSHWSEGYMGSLSVRDDDQIIETETVGEDGTFEYTRLRLLSKGGNRVVQLGFFKGVTVSGD